MIRLSGKAFCARGAFSNSLLMMMDHQGGDYTTCCQLPISRFGHHVLFMSYLTQDPKAAAAQMVVSPLTGEMVPYDQMEEHMRINLIDPRYCQTASLAQFN